MKHRCPQELQQLQAATCTHPDITHLMQMHDRFPHRFRHTCTTISTLSPLPTCPMYMYRQPQQTNTRGSHRKAALGTGWRWWLHTLFQFRNCFDGSSIEHQCHSTSTLTWYHPRFGSRLVVCYQRSWSHSPPAWIVLRPVFPGTQHWKGLTSTGVADLRVQGSPVVCGIDLGPRL